MLTHKVNYYSYRFSFSSCGNLAKVSLRIRGPSYLQTFSIAPEMEDMMPKNKEFISVWVCDPRLHREDFWHTHIDYGICLHTNSMCFCKKTSYVRRRYSEFVWLRQRLQDNALLVQLPKLPPANPFFSLNNTLQITQRMDGLHKFLEAVLKMPLLLSDSHLHLFLQSRLSIAKMEACVQGQTRYTVAQAIQCSVYEMHIPLEEESKSSCDSNCESTSSSGFGISIGSVTPIETSAKNGSPTQFLAMDPQPEFFKCLSSSSDTQHGIHS